MIHKKIICSIFIVSFFSIKAQAQEVDLFAEKNDQKIKDNG